MKIETLELTDQEMNQAVTEFLRWRGMNLTVANIDGKGYPRRAWEITLSLDAVLPAPREPAKPEIRTVEELGTAIEKGEI